MTNSFGLMSLMILVDVFNWIASDLWLMTPWLMQCHDSWVWLCDLVEAKSLHAHAIHNGVNVVGGQPACFAGQAQQRARPVLPAQKRHDTLWSKGHWSSTWHRWRQMHLHHLFMMLSIGHALSRYIIHFQLQNGLAQTAGSYWGGLNQPWLITILTWMIL